MNGNSAYTILKGEIDELSSSIASISPTLNKSADTTFTLTAHEFHVVEGTPTALTVGFATPAEDEDFCPTLVFKAGSGLVVTYTEPTGYTVEFADEPTFTAGNLYEISYRYLHVDGVISGVCKEL